jgi:Flp pilus assembly protein CpaB
MGRRTLILLGVLLFVSAIVVVAALLFLQPSPPPTNGTPVGNEPTSTPAPTAEPMVQVVIASQPRKRGEAIIEGTFNLAPWPKSSVDNLPVFITDPAQLEGKVARVPILQGEPILTTMLVDDLIGNTAEHGSDTAAQIPPGYVAISLPYDKNNGVSLGIRDGDHINIIVSWALVDIDQQFQTTVPNRAVLVEPPNPDGTLPNLGTTDVSVIKLAEQARVGKGEDGVNIPNDFYVIPSEPQRPRFVTQGIIQDAIVLHLGDFGPDIPYIVPTATPVPQEGTPTAAPPPTPTPIPPATITLLVSPQDALVLNYIHRLMERYPASVVMTLVLRSSQDNGVAQAATNSVTLQYMFETYNIALPAKLNYGPSGPTIITVPPSVYTTTIANELLP